MLLSSNVPIHINPPIPDPAVSSVTQSVTCSYYAAKDLMLSWKLFDPNGEIVTLGLEMPISAGDGSFVIPLKQITASGAHYLDVTVRDAASGAHSTITSKFTVMK